MTRNSAIIFPWRMIALAVTFWCAICLTAAWAQDGKSVVKLHIPGYSPNSLPFQIAEDQGFYKEQGITVETLRMKTGAGVQAMLAGSADVTQVLGLTLRGAISKGAPVKIVMVFNDRPLYRLLAKKTLRRSPI
jgi:ABC-type nitrate/sulfonate/bicarbonate transport system substrate-binding protein